MPRLVLQAIGLHYFEIPGYEATVRYDVRIDAFRQADGQETLLGYGTDSNDRYCTSTPDPASDTQNDFTTIQVLVDGTVSPHAGSSLVVNIEGGNIVARDNTLGTSLSAPGSCVANQTLASSDSLVISCTPDGNFKVLQVHPQHPGDGRRDILVFNAALTNCYRAYEYLETGAIEVFYRKC